MTLKKCYLFSVPAPNCFILVYLNLCSISFNSYHSSPFLSVYRPGWPYRDLVASASHVLGLKMYTIHFL